MVYFKYVFLKEHLCRYNYVKTVIEKDIVNKRHKIY